jgi:L-alanine-DL-glutamate epimerase-like enolase superfamily enzyme
MSTRIRDVAVATVRAPLPEPIRFGDWVMPHREFALARLRTEDGAEGISFTLTREGPVAATIRQAIAHRYAGAELATPADAAALFAGCQRSNLAGLSAGIGLRALSIVDLAAYDLLARRTGLCIARYLGGAPRPLPTTAIVGYPPSMGPDAVAEQVRTLRTAGWRRFKIPICLPLERARERTLAAREAAGADAWLGMDGAWIFTTAQEAADFLGTLAGARLDWFEDVVPPGDAELIAQVRARADGVAIATGDEQGGSYYPEALLRAAAVDAVRVDLTCMGGISGGRRVLDACAQAGVRCWPHMFAHVHSQVLAGWGIEAPIEWGVPGTGVDQYADSLRQPRLHEGMMAPLDEQPGFGPMAEPEWLASLPGEDPDGLIASLST